MSAGVVLAFWVDKHKFYNFLPSIVGYKIKMSMSKLYISILVVLCVLLTSTVIASDANVDVVINGYEGYVKSLYPISVCYDEVSSYKARSITKNGSIVCDNHNYLVSMNSRSSTNDKESRKEFLFNEGKYLSLFKDSEQDDIALGSWLNPQDNEVSFVQYCFFPECFGFFQPLRLGEYEYLPSFLKKVKSDVVVNRDEHNPNILLLVARHRDFSLEIKLSDTRSHLLPISFNLKGELVAGSTPESGRVLNYECFFDDYVGKFPRSYRYSITYVNFDTIDGKRTRINDKYSGTVTFSNAKIGSPLSKLDFRIQTSIPDYTEVFMYDVPQIKYVWLDGNVEPLTDALAEERLHGHRFIPGVADSRFWLMFVGFILFASALAKLIWDYFKNKNNKGDDDDNE